MLKFFLWAMHLNSQINMQNFTFRLSPPKLAPSLIGLLHCPSFTHIGRTIPFKNLPGYAISGTSAVHRWSRWNFEKVQHKKIESMHVLLIFIA